MNGQLMTARKYSELFLAVLVLMIASAASHAQVPVDEDGNTLPAYYEDDLDLDSATTSIDSVTVYSPAELETLVGPIALYPDDLLAIVLPASTYPLEIVQAARFLERVELDESLKPDDEWDDSVVALLNYPDVVQMMNDDIDWTWRLGEAVIGQQAAVIAAVEAFRDRAYAAGNLKSDANQTVTYADGTIEIEPVSEEIIYVPYYEPAEVVVHQPRTVYHYYPNPYPVYYYPYPVDYRFRSRYFWGVTTAFSIGWSNHYLHVYHPTYWGHPYYGRTYYDYYYRRPSISIYNNWYVNNSYRSNQYRYRDGDYWRPRIRAGSRQDEPRVRNYHYPPGGDQRRRQDYNGRSALNNRDNGRLDLNLRQRDENDRARAAANNRLATRSNTRTGTAGDNDRRSNTNTRSTREAAPNRQNTTRTPSGNNRTTRSDTRSDDNNRPTVNSRSPNTAARENAPRPEIRFRNRDNSDSVNRTGRAENTRGTRPSAPSTTRGSSNRETQQRAASPRTVTPRVTAPSRSTPKVNSAPRNSTQRQTPRSSAPRATAPRSSTPKMTAPRQSAPRASAPRQSAPRVSAPKPSAPRASAPRQSAPRMSAPRISSPRASAPRQSAPRVAAPKPSAPRASAPRQSAPREASSTRAPSRSRSSSRPRNGSN